MTTSLLARLCGEPLLVVLEGEHVVATPLHDLPRDGRVRAHGIEVHIAYGTPLGVRAEVLTALEERVAAVEEGLPALPAAETAVLLVERGSSDPDANANVFKVARLLWEGRGEGLVETCFWSITGANLAEGLRRCAALGARRIIVLPYFLFQSVLLQRIAAMVEAHRALPAGIELRVAPHLGTHPALVDLVLHRAREATAGEARSNCDLCKYRVVMPGFVHEQGRPQGSDHAHGLRGHHEHGDQRHPFLTR